MALLKDLGTKFAQLQHDYDALSAQSDLAEEDNARLDTMLNDMKSVKSQIEREKEKIALAEWGQQSSGGIQLAGAADGAKGMNFEGFSPAADNAGIIDPELLGRIGTKAYSDSFRQYMKTGLNGMRAEAIKTLQEGQDTEGGFLVPPDILSKVVQKEPAPTTVQSHVTQLNTGRDALILPKVNYASATDDSNGWIYTTGMRVTWTGEVPSSSTAMRVTDPVFGQIRIPVHTAMLSLPITQDLIEDVNFDLLGWVSGKFAETRDLLIDNMILNGTGIGQPYGILNNPGGTAQPSVIGSGSSGNFTADTLMKCAFNLPPQYDMNAYWVVEKTTSLLQIAQLKDGNGRYIYGVGTQDSGIAGNYKDRQLLGYPVLMNQFMPVVAGSAYAAVFGDLSGYYLVNRVGLSIQVLRELYAETNQVLVLGRLRFGGQVAEDWKLRAYQLS